MRWIVIYPVDSAIQRLNSRNLAYKIHTHFHWGLVCYTAVFSVVTQRSSPQEERCVTTLKTAV